MEFTHSSVFSRHIKGHVYLDTDLKPHVSDDLHQSLQGEMGGGVKFCSISKKTPVPTQTLHSHMCPLIPVFMPHRSKFAFYQLPRL